MVVGYYVSRAGCWFLVCGSWLLVVVIVSGVAVGVDVGGANGSVVRGVVVVAAVAAVVAVVVVVVVVVFVVVAVVVVVAVAVAVVVVVVFFFRGCVFCIFYVCFRRFCLIFCGGGQCGGEGGGLCCAILLLNHLCFENCPDVRNLIFWFVCKKNKTTEKPPDTRELRHLFLNCRGVHGCIHGFGTFSDQMCVDMNCRLKLGEGIAEPQLEFCLCCEFELGNRTYGSQ